MSYCKKKKIPQNVQSPVGILLFLLRVLLRIQIIKIQVYQYDVLIYILYDVPI